MKLFRRPVRSLKSLDIIWICRESDDVFEDIYSHDYCRKTSRELCETYLNLGRWIDLKPGQSFDKALETVASDCLLIVGSPVVVISPSAVEKMLETLEKGFDACFPVYNEAPVASQVAELPEIYLNLSTYLEVAEIMSQKKVSLFEGEHSPDTSCGLFKMASQGGIRSFNLEAWTDILSVFSFSAQYGKSAINSCALIHSFGIYGDAQREDLAALVPVSAKSILDVGCARGGFGEMMRKKRLDLELTGVEMNPVMAAQAALHYDRVFTENIENLAFDLKFDHINCGDIIEHLYDPWRILDYFFSVLKNGGTLVVSLPNAGHWTIVRDLANGEFPYLPFGLLCVTHIRWFTEKTIKSALANAGFKIMDFNREQLPPTPRGRDFIDMMCRGGYGDETSLLTNQFTLRAVKNGDHHSIKSAWPEQCFDTGQNEG